MSRQPIQPIKAVRPKIVFIQNPVHISFPPDAQGVFVGTAYLVEVAPDIALPVLVEV